jgi:hypothetical protein
MAFANGRHGQAEEGLVAATVTPPRVLIAGHLEDARRELQAAKEVAKADGEGEIYVWLNSRIGELDAMRSELAEREGS